MSTETGRQGEDLASAILQKAGYKIIDKNYRSRFGEIDIIAEIKKVYVFVEVKYRKDMGFGLPQEVVTKVKLNKIRKTAELYLYENKLAPDWRIDVITINPVTKDFELFDNVFTLGMA